MVGRRDEGVLGENLPQRCSLHSGSPVPAMPQLSSVVSLTLVLQQSLRLSGLTVLQEDPGGGPYSCGMAGRGGGGRR